MTSQLGAATATAQPSRPPSSIVASFDQAIRGCVAVIARENESRCLRRPDHCGRDELATFDRLLRTVRTLGVRDRERAVVGRAFGDKERVLLKRRGLLI